MSDDKIDFKRVLHDHEYRHEVMDRLNRESGDQAKLRDLATTPCKATAK